jgi:hypothetical protein
MVQGNSPEPVRRSEMARTLVVTAEVEVDGRSYPLRYYEQLTVRGGLRFSCEVLLGDNDRIIVDDDSMAGLESKVSRLAPATIYSRLLAARSSRAA